MLINVKIIDRNHPSHRQYQIITIIIIIIIDCKHAQDVTELRWLIASSPSCNEFTETQPICALLNLNKEL